MPGDKIEIADSVGLNLLDANDDDWWFDDMLLIYRGKWSK